MVAESQVEADEWVAALSKTSRTIKKSAAVFMPLPKVNSINYL